MASKETVIRIVAEMGPETKHLLADIRDRLPQPVTESTSIFQEPTPMLRAKVLVHAKRHALKAVLEALQSWVEGARANHEASGHRHENRGEECWRQFHPADIRNMVNDAARELGLSEFSDPEKGDTTL